MNGLEMVARNVANLWPPSLKFSMANCSNGNGVLETVPRR